MSAPELSVQPLGPDDPGVLLRLARACPPLDVHTAYTYWVVSHLFASTSFLLVDEASGRVAGYATGVPSGETMFCWQVGVLPEYRGWGGSRLLFGAVADRAIEMGMMRIETTVGGHNEASKAAIAGFVRERGLTATAVRGIEVPERDGEEAETLVVIDLVG